MRVILSEFTLANFKSYREGRLPLGSLSIAIYRAITKNLNRVKVAE